MTDKEFLEEVQTYFWVEAWYIEAVLKELDDKRKSPEDLLLTEQFNIWYNEWLKAVNKQLEHYFSQADSKPIEDFRDIDPTSNVEDIVITDKITDWTNESIRV